jgi:hypothetical protein
MRPLVEMDQGLTIAALSVKPEHFLAIGTEAIGAHFPTFNPSL